MPNICEEFSGLKKILLSWFCCLFILLLFVVREMIGWCGGFIRKIVSQIDLSAIYCIHELFLPSWVGVGCMCIKVCPSGSV